MANIATTLDQQIKLLQSRGMIIKDIEKAKEVLFDVGYYRLGFYWFPFETSYPSKIHRNHLFKSNTSFDDAVKLYYFDFNLRNVLLKALSRIEIAFRTKLIYLVSNDNKFSPAWFVDSTVVDPRQSKYFSNGAYEALKSKYSVIKWHHLRHPDDEYAPAWKTIEFMTLGEVFHLFKSLKNSRTRLLIAKEFGIRTIVTLENYLEVIKNMRNVCAHGNVLYDFRPEKSIRKGPAMMKGIEKNQNLNGAIHVIIYMLQQISDKRSQELQDDIKSLLSKYSESLAVKKILLSISGFGEI